MGDRLDPIFNPKVVAVIGASRQKGKVGYAILHNLIANEYQGTIYPVNPNAESVHSIRAYPSVLDIPGPVDLAIVCVPADATLVAAEECAKKGVKGLVVITAGFREIGGPGEERERRLKEIVRTNGMTMIGPNCMGVINTNPAVQMDATFAPTPPRRGRLSFMSQSGALGVAILDHAKSLNLGFAKFVSLGNKTDVSGNDLLMSWEDDPDTHVILMYLENFGNPRNFARLARRISRKKPIIAVKSGRTEAGGRATVSHTGSLGGSDVAAEAVFQQTGVIRAYSIDELFDYAMAFTRIAPPAGKRIAIVTDAGGPAILCTDALIERGLEMAQLTPATVASMKEWAPKEASLQNPVDLIASAGPEEYRKAIEAVLADENVDAVVAIYVPPIVTHEVDVARAIWQAGETSEKPLLCNFLGRNEESPGFVELVQHDVPSYLYPEAAARTLAALCRYRDYVTRKDGEFPEFAVDRAKAEAILNAATAGERKRLSEVEALDLVAAYGLRTAKTRSAEDAPGALASAKEIGFPVVLKAVGERLVHKTEQKAVAVDLRDDKEFTAEFAKMEKRLAKAGISPAGWIVQEFVKGGREVILGMNRDRVFGPLLVFGLGGIYVEYLKDVAFGLAPITDEDARRMIESIKTYPLLAGVRGEKASDVNAVRDALLRLSQLANDLEAIKEIDLNPVLVLEKGQGYRVVDARIVL